MLEHINKISRIITEDPDIYGDFSDDDYFESADDPKLMGYYYGDPRTLHYLWNDYNIYVDIPLDKIDDDDRPREWDIVKVDDIGHVFSTEDAAEIKKFKSDNQELMISLQHDIPIQIKKHDSAST